MPKFIIQWNAGYGDSFEEFEAETQKAAEDYAYERWNEDVQSQADWSAQPYTKEAAVDCGLEEEEWDDDEE